MKSVTCTQKDGVYVLTLNAPQNLNAMSYELLNELSNCLDAVRNDVHCRAVILTGNGRGFCSGAELAAMDTRIAEEDFGAGVTDFMKSVCTPIVEAIQSMRVPVIGAVNGLAVGGGFGLAMACHIVIAANSAYFSLPFVPKLGLMPDMGATWFMPRFIGKARALAMCLLGDRVSAKEAVDMGLIYKCVEDEKLLEEANALAQRLAQLPPNVFSELCNAFVLSERSSLREQLDFEAERQGFMIEQPAFKDAVTEFLRPKSVSS